GGAGASGGSGPTCNGTLELPGPPLTILGTFPYAAATADLNNDGKPDMAVANYDDKDVSVLFNDGHGVFGGKTDYAAGGQPAAIVAADLNGDGKPDLAVANSGDSTVSVLINQGAGTFAGKV